MPTINPSDLAILAFLLPTIGLGFWHWWNHSKGVRYFVVYVHAVKDKAGGHEGMGQGTASVTVSSKIDCIEKIQTLEENIEEEEGYEKVQIVNFRRFD